MKTQQPAAPRPWQLLLLAPALLLGPALKGAAPSVFCLPISACIYAALAFRLLAFKTDFRLPDGRRMIEMGLLLALLGLSFLAAPYKFAALMEWNRVFSCVILYFLLVQLVRDKSQTLILLCALGLLGGALSLFGFLQLAGLAPSQWWDRAYFMSAGYVNHNHFAGLLEMTLPLAAAGMHKAKSARLRSMLALSVGLSAAGLMLSMSRGGWLSALGALFVFILLRPGRKRAKSAVAVVLLTVTCLSAVAFSSLAPKTVLGQRIGTLGGMLGDFHTQNITRPVMWKDTLTMIRANPLGIGCGQFVHEYPKYRNATLVCLLVYAHNDYLHYTAEMGLGFLALAALFLWGIARRAALLRKAMAEGQNQAAATAALCGVAAICLHSLVDFNLHLPANAWVFTALVFLLHEAPEPQD